MVDNFIMHDIIQLYYFNFGVTMCLAISKNKVFEMTGIRNKLDQSGLIVFSFQNQART